MHKHLISAVLATCFCFPVMAQDAPAASKPLVSSNPYFNAEANKDAVDKGTALGKDIVDQILKAYETTPMPEVEVAGQEMSRKFDAIANGVMAEDREKILEFLGLNPEDNAGLYYFVTWEMPLSLLRAYVIEAMWSGGTLVFKGVPPGKGLFEFLKEDVRQLVYGKGAAVNISLDPRLFDIYQVSVAPTIVFTKAKDLMTCDGGGYVPVKVQEVETGYTTCPAVDPESYWKISGSVTSSYALDLFIENGAKEAVPYRQALAKGFATEEGPGKVQRPFAGKWEDAISPSELQAAREAAKAIEKPLERQN